MYSYALIEESDAEVERDSSSDGFGVMEGPPGLPESPDIEVEKSLLFGDGQLAMTIYMWFEKLSIQSPRLHLEWLSGFRAWADSLMGRPFKVLTQTHVWCSSC